MRPLRFCINLTLMVVPPTLLAVGAYRFVGRVFGYLNSDARLASVVSVEASRLLKREVRVGDVHITGNLFGLDAANRVELRDVFVANGPNASYGTFVRADKVTAWYSLRHLLLTNDPRVPQIDELQLIGPEARLSRDAKGRWNFEDLLKQTPQTGGRRFADKLTFQKGILRYADAAFPHPPDVSARTLVTTLANLNGVVLIRPDKSVAFDIGATGEPALFRDFHVTGIAGLAPLQVNAHLVANRVALPFVGQRLVAPQRARLLSGLADMDVSALYLPRPGQPATVLDLKALTANGDVKLTNVALAAPQLGETVQNVAGGLTFTTDSLAGNLSGRYAGTSFAVNGSALGLIEQILGAAGTPRNISATPTLALSGTVGNLDFARLLRLPLVQSNLIRLPQNVRTMVKQTRGQGQGQFVLRGSLANPNIAVNAQLNSLQSGRYRLANVEARATLANKRINAFVRSRAAGGELVARGQVNLGGDRAFAVEAHGRNVDLAALDLPLKQQIGGIAQLDLTAQGRPGIVPKANLQAQVTNVRLNNQTFQNLYVRADTVGQFLVLRSLRAEDTKGFAQAQGLVTVNPNNLAASKLALNVEADEINLGAIVQAFPDLNAQMERALAPLQRQEDRRQETGDKSNAVASKNSSSFIPHPSSLSGTAYFRARIGGTAGDPKARGELAAYALRAGEIRLDKASANFDASRRALVINEGAIRRYPGEVRFAGVLANPLQANRSLSLTANLDRFDVPDTLKTLGIDTGKNLILGSVSTDDALVEGPLNALRLRRPVTIKLEDASINGLPIQDAIARLRYDPTQGATLEQANLKIAGGTIEASGTVKPNGPIDLTARASGIDVETLAGALPEGQARDQLVRASGTVGFDAKVSGTTKNPEATVALNGKGLSYDNVALGDVTGRADYADNRLTVENLTLAGGTSALAPGQSPLTGNSATITRLAYNIKTKEISGTAHLDALTTQRVREAIQTSAFGPTETGKTLIDLLDRIGGNLSATATFGGTTDNPRADVTWRGQNLAIGQQQIQTLEGSARLTKDRLVAPSPVTPALIPRVESYLAGADKPDAVIVARSLDFQFRQPGQPGMGPIAADITAYNVNLGLLQTLAPPSAAAAVQKVVQSAVPQTPVKNPNAVPAANTAATPGTTPDTTTTQATNPISLSGIAEVVGISVSGTADAPVVDLSATLRNVGVANSAVASLGVVTIDRIDLDHARIEEGNVTVDGVRIAKNDANNPQADPYTAEASGTIGGFRWQAPFLPADASLNLRAEIPKQSLQFISAFLPGTTTPPTDPKTTAQSGPISTKGKPLTPVAQTLVPNNPLRDTQGTFSAKVTVTGTRAKPNVQGNVDVSAPKIRVAGAATGLRDVDASFGFEGDRIAVRRFTATPQVYDQRGDPVAKKTSQPLQLNGSIALGLGTPGASAEAGAASPGLTLYDPQLIFDESPLPTIGSGSARGVALVNLKLTGELLRGPVLSGNVTISNAQATIPKDFGPGTAGTTAFAFPVRFDNLSLNFGKNVALVNPALNARLDENQPNFITLNGDLNDPRIQGRLAIGKGSLILPTAKFTILPPAYLSLNYPVPNETIPGLPTLGLTVNLRAQTNLTATSRLGVRKRYRVTVAANGPLTGSATDPTTGRSRFNLTFQTDPNDLAASQEELTARLAGALVSADTFTELQRNPGQAFAGLLTNVFTSAVIPGVFDRLASSWGFDEFLINYDPVQRLTLLVSRQLFGPFYVTYNRSLGTSQENYDLKLSLRFKERYQVSYSIDEQRTQQVLLEGVWNY